MSFVMEENELTNPEPVCLLGPRAEMASTADDGDLLKQAGLCGCLITP